MSTSRLNLELAYLINPLEKMLNSNEPGTAIEIS